MNVLDIFYKNIVPEATQGRINCLSYYNMAFSTKIVEENREYLCRIEDDNLFIPTLMIKDKKKFDELLVEYVSLALKFYDNSNFDEEILGNKLYDEKDRICKEKVILSLLFANATIEDFNDPIEFLKKRINFIYNDLSNKYDFGYCEVLNGDLSLEVKKDIINNETPYEMVIKVKSISGDDFVFPRIKFGISDDTVYVYAIQNKMNDNNTFCKKMNRILYKVGEGYRETDENDSENLRDITASFLVALNIGISFLVNKGYSKIVVPSLLVERWNAKRITNLLKIKFKKLNEIEALDIMNSQDYIQQNLTNKLIRTFLRLGCHYNNIEVLSFPFELDSCLHIGVDDKDITCNNALLYKTYMAVEEGMFVDKKKMSK